MSVLNFSQFSAIVNFLFLPHFLWFGQKWRIEELQLRVVQVAQPLRMYRAKKKKKKKKASQWAQLTCIHLRHRDTCAQRMRGTKRHLW